MTVVPRGSLGVIPTTTTEQLSNDRILRKDVPTSHQNFPPIAAHPCPHRQQYKLVEKSLFYLVLRIQNFLLPKQAVHAARLRAASFPAVLYPETRDMVGQGDT